MDDIHHSAHGCQKRALDSLNQSYRKLWVTIAVGSKLGPSARAANALKHWAIPLAPMETFSKQMILSKQSYWYLFNNTFWKNTYTAKENVRLRGWNLYIHKVMFFVQNESHSIVVANKVCPKAWLVNCIMWALETSQGYSAEPWDCGHSEWTPAGNLRAEPREEHFKLLGNYFNQYNGLND